MKNIELEINDENEEIRPLPSTDDDSEPTVIYESAAYYSEQAVLWLIILFRDLCSPNRTFEKI